MRKNWQQFEDKTAETFNGKHTPGSGNKWGAKGDIKSEKFLIECKTTMKDNFTIQGKVWQKIAKEALLEGRLPILSVEFGSKKVELIVLDKNDFVSLLP